MWSKCTCIYTWETQPCCLHTGRCREGLGETQKGILIVSACAVLVSVVCVRSLVFSCASGKSEFNCRKIATPNDVCTEWYTKNISIRTNVGENLPNSRISTTHRAAIDDQTNTQLGRTRLPLQLTAQASGPCLEQRSPRREACCRRLHVVWPGRLDDKKVSDLLETGGQARGEGMRTREPSRPRTPLAEEEDGLLLPLGDCSASSALPLLVCGTTVMLIF